MPETVDAVIEVNSTSAPESSDQKLPSLWRNRAFTLLWGSQAMSDLGSSMSNLALPLLTLAITRSPVQAGVVGTAGALVRLACQLPAGVVTDRFERRRLMLAADAIRLIAYAILGFAVITDRVTLTWIIVTTVIVSVFNVAHENAQMGAIRNVVPLAQVPDATARNEARGAAVSLVGPPIGGALYSLSRSVPFFADAISYLLSFVGVWLVREPLQQERTEPHGHPVKELIEGVKFTLAEPFLRAVLFIAAPMNLAFNGLAFAIIVILQQQGTPPALIGVVETIFGVGVLAGALLAPWITRRVSLRQLAIGITWLGVALIAISATLTGSILVGVPMAMAIFFGPACNAALFGYQAAITPDRLQGRVVSVIFLAAMSLASVAALLGGLLVHWWGGPAAILAFAAILSISAIAATVSKGIRKMRPLSEIVAAG
ncbi:MFS transporter [Rhizocola hellebori]|uniref:MFS transporter n=1 Tax=Rhizocola hellebori TaxID=1392758 RepID=A0A8J3QCJ4_9ACTN|nr:MFS transporter [Rhizocola hellebori]GIH06951.1 MFS transporter [Rhizocola hellebori]